MIRVWLSSVSLCALSLFMIGCRHEPFESSFDPQGYPTEVADIMIRKCATSGCHNNTSKAAAGGLSLASWEKLFEGSRGGSSVIPYRPDQSFLLFFVNTDSTRGVTLSPTMPFNDNPLDDDEYNLLVEWIANGALNSDGLVKFAENALRSKFYVTNQGCDMVAVFDAQTKTLMRYIDVGSSGEIESPHQVKISPDGKFWYVIFFSGTIIQKFNAEDDSYVGEVELGTGSWNTFRISSDNRYAYVIDWSANGSVAVVDLENMQLAAKYGNGQFEWPHGSYVTSSGNTLYVTAQHGNFVYKIDLTDLQLPDITNISLNGISPTTVSWLDPHEIEMTPDESKYFVTCQKSNEVRVMRTQDDGLIDVIPTGDFPQEFAISEALPYLFVSCTEDISTFPGKTGSVHVIDYSNNTLVKTIYTGHQPHGMAVDDNRKRVYVSHRNTDPNGPAPHHSTDCGGRNGYVTIIDMTTLELLPDYKVEVSVDPYGVGFRE